MTIEKHIEHLLDIMDSMPDDTCGDWRDSLAFAVDTMRKYQQIKEIVGNYGFDTSWLCLKKIREVIEKVVEDDKI
jgi:hypothetical protein